MSIIGAQHHKSFCHFVAETLPSTWISSYRRTMGATSTGSSCILLFFLPLLIFNHGIAGSRDITVYLLHGASIAGTGPRKLERTQRGQRQSKTFLDFWNLFSFPLRMELLTKKTGGEGSRWRETKRSFGRTWHCEPHWMMDGISYPRIVDWRGGDRGESDNNCLSTRTLDCHIWHNTTGWITCLGQRGLAIKIGGSRPDWWA